MKKHKSINPENLVEALELPKDLILGMPIITLTGNREMLIENHRGLIDYSDKQMVILSKEIRIQITGINLNVEYYTGDMLKIKGKIGQINFLI